MITYDKKQAKSLLIELAERDKTASQYSAVSTSKSIYRHNTAVLKGIIHSIAWPTVKLVGQKASFSAWLIAQHSDHDWAFQLKCLGCMLPDIRRNADTLRSSAYLVSTAVENRGILAVWSPG